MKVIALATPRNSILALDLVRGLAAIEVMLTHLRGGNWVEFGALPTSQRTSVVELFFLSTRLGHEAVLIFFVLSGFLVGGNLISRLRAGRFSIADYAIDRGTRILIPLVPACVLTVSINLGIFSDAVGALQAVGNVFGLNGVLVDTLPRNAPLWSLAYEIWFYVLAGAVAAIFTGKTGPLAVMAILFAALVFAKLGALYVLFWSFGALTAQMRCHSTLARRQCLVGLAMVALGLIAYQLGATSKSFSNIVLLSPAHAETLICLGFCASIPALDGNWVNQALAPAGNVIRFISQISFSLYLIHDPINAWLCVLLPKSDKIDPVSIGAFFVKMAACLLAAYVFWLLFERTSFAVRRAIKASLRVGHAEEIGAV